MQRAEVGYEGRTIYFYKLKDGRGYIHGAYHNLSDSALRAKYLLAAGTALWHAVTITAGSTTTAGGSTTTVAAAGTTPTLVFLCALYMLLHTWHEY